MGFSRQEYWSGVPLSSPSERYYYLYIFFCLRFGWHHRLNGHEFKQTQGDCEDRGAWMLPSMESQRVRHNWATQQKQHVPNFANLSSWFLSSWRPSSLCLLNLIHSGFWKFFLLWQVCVFQIYALHYCIDPGPVTAYFSYSSFYNSCYVPTH